MKNKFITIFLSSLLIIALAGCEKEDNKILFQGGTNPLLKASSTAPMVLSAANASNAAIKFEWTNPEYRFNTGISSQDVIYILEVDTTGSNFTNPGRQLISVSKDLEKNFTVKDLNAVLSKMNLQENIPHQMEFRVKSTIAGDIVPLYSNVIKITITPYLDVVVPIPASGKLFITGSATPGNWMGGGDPELASQQFTQVNPSLYVINSIALTGGGSYLFVPVYGNWSNKYGFVGSGNGNNVNGDEFKAEGNDILAPSVSGNYKIEVNFKTGRFTVTKL